MIDKGEGHAELKMIDTYTSITLLMFWEHPWITGVLFASSAIKWQQLQGFTNMFAVKPAAVYNYMEVVRLYHKSVIPPRMLALVVLLI